jgi:phosphate starvation-inducible membrane PsiE
MNFLKIILPFPLLYSICTALTAVCKLFVTKYNKETAIISSFVVSGILCPNQF